MSPHDLPAGSKRAGMRPEEIVEQMAPKQEDAAKK
jgi:NAD(P)H-quinone oxidoreductase subunit I